MELRRLRIRRVGIGLALGAVMLFAGALSKAGNQAYAQMTATPTLTADITPSGEGGAITQADVEQFAWDSFLALSNPSSGTPLWKSWSSTADLLNPWADPMITQPPDSGTHYYPTECTDSSQNGVPEGDTYTNYRVLEEVGKIDDAFLEATQQGLSNSPVVAQNGTFLRYEIMLSPATYTWIVDQQLYDAAMLNQMYTDQQPVAFFCSNPDATAGETPDDNPDMGPIVLKLAWMDTENIEDTSTFYMDQLLVYTPDYRNSTNTATCKLTTMALVGVHLVRKTGSQAAWTWSTFEHVNNAPDCSGLPPAPTMGSFTGANTHGVNMGCPTTGSTDYNLNPQTMCLADDPAMQAQCQWCNLTPTSNATNPAMDCINPEDPAFGAWCLDQPPNAVTGYSQLCRQVPVATYADANTSNGTVQGLSGIGIWANYQLIGTQWFQSTSADTTCDSTTPNNVSDTVGAGSATTRQSIMPLINLGTEDDPMDRPILGNTSMESYERSSCMACHQKATYPLKAPSAGKPPAISTDFSYWLTVEVTEANRIRSGGN